MLNLDTHILLHAVAGNLTKRERELLASDRWSISAIVLWEIAKLAQLGRIEVDLDDAEVVRTLAAVEVWPITAEIARDQHAPRRAERPGRRVDRRHERRPQRPARHA